MRVTVAMMYQDMILNLNRKTENTDRLSNMIASGKRMAKPQDDPVGWSQAMDLKQGFRELEAFQNNVDFAVSWNRTTSNALNSFTDLMVQAIQVGTEAINNSVDKETQIKTVDLISQQAMDLANTKYLDRYVFSGTSFSTAPFDENLEYVGNTDNLEVRVGTNNRQAINLDGQSAFIPDASDAESNIFKRLAALKAAIETGDTTEIQAQTEALESAEEHIRNVNALTGSRLSYLDGRTTSLQTLKLSSSNQLSEIEDTNTAEAIVQLQQNQTALQAALQVTAMLDDLSLVNFL